MVEPGRLGARQGRVPVPHSTAPITLGGCPRGVAGMGPGLTRTRGGGGAAGPARRAPQRPPPPAPAGVAANGRARTSAPERHTDDVWGRYATANQNGMGAAPPMSRASPVTPAVLPARGGRRAGRVCRGPKESGSRAAPPPSPRQAAPAARGAPATPTERAHRGGNAQRTRGGQGGELWAAPQRESRGAAAQPPPHLPHRPASRGGASPHPPEAERMVPPPPSRTMAPQRGARARPAPPPQPPGPTGTAGNKRTRANAPGRNTDRAQRRQASMNRSGMGATPSMTRTKPETPALLPAQGRQRDGARQSEPPPQWPPRPHKRRTRRTAPPPPSPPPERANPPHGGRTTPSQVVGKRDRAAPPKARQMEQGTGAGHAEGHGPRGTALPSPSAGTARGARATPTRGGGGGKWTPRERERTHTQRARGEYHKGNRTELAERTDRVEWRASERG